MTCIFSNPTGNANARAAARGLLDSKILNEFHTTIASFPGSMLDNLGSIKPLSEIRRRRFDPALKPVTRTWPLLEAARLLSLKTGFSNLVKHEKGLFCVDAVCQNLDKHVAATLKRLSRRGVGAVYAYEDGAFFSFREAKKWNLACLYDLPIGYWRASRQLLLPERERWPEWVPTMAEFLDSEEKLNRKDDELRLADKIFVASSFTASTLAKFPGNLAPVKIVPYGFPPPGSNREYRSFTNKRPLKLLFVGGLSQRKGIANLFESVKKFGKNIELTLVGHKGSNNCVALDKALANHTWIPSLPNADILTLMKEQDIFIFPSLFEGFGLVITEAMSQGTPVITTERTAGPDFIKHGMNGWLVEAGSTDAITAAIEDILQRPEMIEKAGREARETARKRPWEIYGKELAEAITN